MIRGFRVLLIAANGALFMWNSCGKQAAARNSLLATGAWNKLKGGLLLVVAAYADAWYAPNVGEHVQVGTKAWLKRAKERGQFLETIPPTPPDTDYGGE